MFKYQVSNILTKKHQLSSGEKKWEMRKLKRERDEGKVAEARDRDNEKKDRETKQKIYLGCHL